MQELREAVRGEILTPDDERLRGGMADRERGPRAAVRRSRQLQRRCGRVAAVGFARSNGLRITVRGGGHSIAGFSTCDDGIVIDLSPMTFRVDPLARRATVGGGAVGPTSTMRPKPRLATRAGLLDHGVGGFHARWRHRLDEPEVRPRVRQPGWGRPRHRRRALVHASETENPDPLWGLRGGGGNSASSRIRIRLSSLGRDLRRPLFYPPTSPATCCTPSASGRGSRQ